VRVNRVVIFANGQYISTSFYLQELQQDDYVIAVDGGANFLAKINITPDLIVGDLDSIAEDVLEKYSQNGIPIKKHKSEKDESDLELTLYQAMELGPSEIVVFGAMGKRIDHLYANITAMLEPMKQGLRIYLKDESQEIMVTDSKLTVYGEPGDYLSLFPLSKEANNIKSTGLKYSLNGETLYLGPSRGLSNEFINNKATVTLTGGYLLVIKTLRREG